MPRTVRRHWCMTMRYGDCAGSQAPAWEPSDCKLQLGFDVKQKTARMLPLCGVIRDVRSSETRIPLRCIRATMVLLPKPELGNEQKCRTGFVIPSVMFRTLANNSCHAQNVSDGVANPVAHRVQKIIATATRFRKSKSQRTAKAEQQRSE